MVTHLLVLPLIVVAAVTTTESSRSARRMLSLRNTRWDAVRIELRVGPSSQCDGNSYSVIKTLGRDRTWAVVSNEVICWRREQTPGDAASGWTPWAQARLAVDEVRDVTL